MQKTTHRPHFWPMLIALPLIVGCQNQTVPNTSSTEQAQVQAPALRPKDHGFEAMKAKLVHESRVRHLGPDYAQKQKFKTQADPPAGRYWYPETLRTQSQGPWEVANPPLVNGEYRAQIPFPAFEIPFKDSNQEDLDSGFQYEAPLGYFWQGRGGLNPINLFKNQESDTALIGSNVDGSGSFQSEGTLNYELRNNSNQVVATGNWGSGTLGPLNLSPLLTQANMRLSLFLSKPTSATDTRLSLSQPLYVVNAYSRARRYYEFVLKTDTRFISPSNQLDSYPESVQLDIDFDPLLDSYPDDFSYRVTWAELYQVAANGNWTYLGGLPAPEENGPDRRLTWSGRNANGQLLPDGEYIISVIGANWDDYEKVVIQNGGVVPSPTPSPSATASPPPGGLPEAKLNDLRKDYLDGYNDDIVARAQKVQRKLDWLVQVNQQKLAQLEQEGTGFAVQQTNTNLSIKNINAKIQISLVLKELNKLSKQNRTLANANGCFNYYSFKASPKTSVPSSPGDTEQKLSLKLCTSFNTDSGIYTMGRLVDQEKAKAPDNIQELAPKINPYYFNKILLNNKSSSFNNSTGEVIIYTPYPDYSITNVFKTNSTSPIDTQLQLIEGTNTVKLRSNNKPLLYTWPAGIGQDANKLPIPMYIYHGTESVRTAISNSRNEIRGNSLAKTEFSSLNGFYSNICYDRDQEILGLYTPSPNGVIFVSNQGLMTQLTLNATISHELFHRKFAFQDPKLTYLLEEEKLAEQKTLAIAKQFPYIKNEDIGFMEDQIKDYQIGLNGSSRDKLDLKTRQPGIYYKINEPSSKSNPSSEELKKQRNIYYQDMLSDNLCAP